MIFFAQKRVPPELWGRDHLSCLLYVETVCVDHRGRPDPNRMRPCVIPGAPPVDSCENTLVDGTRAPGGDWDCVTDMEAAGLVENRGTAVNPVWGLTPCGWAAAHAVRRARGEWNSAEMGHPAGGAVAHYAACMMRALTAHDAPLPNPPNQETPT